MGQCQPGRHGTWLRAPTAAVAVRMELVSGPEPEVWQRSECVHVRMCVVCTHVCGCVCVHVCCCVCGVCTCVWLCVCGVLTCTRGCGMYM